MQKEQTFYQAINIDQGDICYVREGNSLPTYRDLQDQVNLLMRINGSLDMPTTDTYRLQVIGQLHGAIDGLTKKDPNCPWMHELALSSLFERLVKILDEADSLHLQAQMAQAWLHASAQNI
uniref:Uncharacterized protein n=1 Tax=Megaviridae environmental sample TaxID=1737588 RepID=A0A5J6VJ56_9VIRU|nr:MAG: hypothetical protein [Megaviridae environmental sample]